MTVNLFLSVIACVAGVWKKREREFFKIGARETRFAFLSTPFPSLSNACHADYLLLIWTIALNYALVINSQHWPKIEPPIEKENCYHCLSIKLLLYFALSVYHIKLRIWYSFNIKALRSPLNTANVHLIVSLHSMLRLGSRSKQRSRSPEKIRSKLCAGILKIIMACTSHLVLSLILPMTEPLLFWLVLKKSRT